MNDFYIAFTGGMLIGVCIGFYAAFIIMKLGERRLVSSTKKP